MLIIKNTIKSICWIVLYFAVQIIAMAATLIFDLLTSKIPFTDINNVELVVDEAIAHVVNSAIPILIVGSLLVIATFALIKYIRKHAFDLPRVKPVDLLNLFFVGIFLNIVLTTALNHMVQFLPESMVDDLLSSTNTAIYNQPVLVVFLGTGILIPIMEEIVFRYGVCGTLARSNKAIALIASSLIFGLIHGNPIQNTYAAALGFLLGYIYLKYDNIWYPIILHVTINSTSLALISTNIPYLSAILLIVSILGVVLLRRVTRKNRPGKKTPENNEIL